MDIYISKLAKSLTPYVPGEQLTYDGLIKLNTNENPYPPSPNAINAMKRKTNDDLRLYPSAECEELRYAISEYHELPGKEYVYAGNGSDELLAFCFAAFFDKDKPVLFPDITYSFYPVYCNLLGLKYLQIPLDENFNININDYNIENAGIIFPNPNAPTGILLNTDEIISLLNKNKDTVVIIDEAYIDFGGKSVSHLIVKYPNLVIIKTLSKSHSLAGLRCGYVTARPKLIDAIIKVKNSFNSYTMDTIAQTGMKEAIIDYRYKLMQCEKIIKTRQKVKKKLSNIGFEVLNSKANFLFLKHYKIPALDIFEFLKNNDILVRHFNTPDRIKNHLRISIGTDSQMNIMVEKLLAYIKSDKKMNR